MHSTTIKDMDHLCLRVRACITTGCLAVRMF